MLMVWEAEPCVHYIFLVTFPPRSRAYEARTAMVLNPCRISRNM
jgi:hypothetical protein